MSGVFDLLPTPVLLVRSRDLTVRYVNPAALHLFEGYLEEVAGTRLSELPMWRDPEAIRELEEVLDARREVSDIQVWATMGTGMDRLLELSSRSLEAEGDEWILLVARDATRQILAKGELRRSEERLAALLRGVPDIVFRHDAHGTYLDVHAPRPEMLAVPRQDLIGANFRDVGLPPDLVAGMEKVFAGAQREGRTQAFEYELELEDGPHHWELQVSPIEEGEFYAVVRNIDDRVRAEETLRASEELFRTIFRHSPLGLAVVGPDETFLEANDELERILGYTREELGERGWADVTLPEDVQKGRDIVEDLVSGRHSSRQIEKRYRRKDGEIVWAELTAALARDANGEPAYFISHIQDITERKRAEKALETALERYRVLFQAVTDAVFIHTVEGEIVEVNDAACEHLGYAREELLGKEVPDIVSPEEAARFDERVGGVLQKPGPEVFESHHLRSDGTVVPVEVVAQTLALEGETLIVSAVRDLTERKREQEQRVRAERLEATARLTAGFAHDINNLMAGVLGNAGLLEEDLKRGEEPSAFLLQDILEAAEEAGALAHQLLSYSGGGSFLPSPVALKDMVRDVLEMPSLSPGPSVSVVLDLGAENDEIFADLRQAEMIVSNVLTNALEAVDESGTVLVQTENFLTERAGGSGEEEWVRLTVKDDGEGMDSFTVAHMFEPFFSSKFTGRGMGMAAAHGAVRHLQGRIDVESAPGEGTTVHIEIPL